MIDMEKLITQDHLLRKIKQKIYFEFIYEEDENYYSPIDSPCIFQSKMNTKCETLVHAKETATKFALWC
jgi:hypothetical protein